MIRIMRQKSLDKALDRSYKRGRQEGNDDLMAALKDFAKEDGQKSYYFGPVSVDVLEVKGSAFFMEIYCLSAYINGNLKGGAITTDGSPVSQEVMDKLKMGTVTKL